MKLAPVAGDPVIIVASRAGQHVVKTGRVAWQGSRVNVVPDPANPFILGERVMLLSRVATQRMQAAGQYAGLTSEGEQFSVLSEWASADKREKPRFELALQVELHVPGVRGIIRGVAADVSEGGMGVVIDHTPESTEFEVLMRNGSFSATMPASLVRAEERPAGVHLSLQFHDLTTAQRAFLRGLLMSLLESPASRSA